MDVLKRKGPRGRDEELCSRTEKTARGEGGPWSQQAPDSLQDHLDQLCSCRALAEPLWVS